MEFKMTAISSKMSGKCIAVPESRQLDIMANLFERRGAEVFRIPLVLIHDAPDSEPILDWIRGFISNPPALFIILTGEGVKRLLALAERSGLHEAFVEALKSTPLLCRGPKPGRALKEISLKEGLRASTPTTEGVIDALQALEIDGKDIAVQLYGEDPNTLLMDYLVNRKGRINTVAPYIYAEDAEEGKVLELIALLAKNKIDAITFTSQPQFRRLNQVAKKHALSDDLYKGLQNCCVAAVGPVVRDQLQRNDVRVDIMPDQAFFMKPLVTEVLRYFNTAEKK
jgi:uroporphyrinogen-III synthase